MRNFPDSAAAEQDYIASLEELIGRDASPEEYYDALEVIFGGSETSETFKGTMMILRRNNQKDLIWDLLHALENAAKEVEDATDRELFEGMIQTALELLDGVEAASKLKTPNAEPEVRNTLRKSGDDYRNRVRNNMERAA